MPENLVLANGHAAFGKVDSTGAAIAVTLGFKPRVILLHNITGLCTLAWYEGMTDAYGLKTVTAGTISLITTGGITQAANGFTIGTDADINPAGGEDIYYTAIG